MTHSVGASTNLQSTATSIYAYDGDNLIEETNASGAAVTRYTQGLNIDEPLAMQQSGVTSYYQVDGLGSVTSLTNPAGVPVQSYTYDSFGNIVATTGSIVNSFRYTGREFDAETSLYYYRARYYDSASDRFLSEDPLFLAGGDVNVYRYAWGNPTNYRDPCGLYGGVDDAVFSGGGAIIGVLGQGIGDVLSGHLSGWQNTVVLQSVELLNCGSSAVRKTSPRRTSPSRQRLPPSRWRAIRVLAASETSRSVSSAHAQNHQGTDEPRKGHQQMSQKRHGPFICCSLFQPCKRRLTRHPLLLAP